MRYRSWLLVPGDSEERLGKAVETGADAVIVDLKDLAAGRSTQEARMLAEHWLRIHRQRIVEHRGVGRWVRINPLGTQIWRDDLAAVMSGAPDGIVLPASAGAEAVRQLAAELQGLEQRHGIPSGSTRIIPVVGTTPEAALNIQAYLEGQLPRLAGLVWDAQALSAALGATRQRDAGGGWTDVFSFVRAQMLLVARVSGIMAIDTFHADLSDEDGLKAAAFAAHADGLAGMLALHPAQVSAIHAAFTPGKEEPARSGHAADDFGTNSGADHLQMSSGLIDRPHLKRARRTMGLDDQSLLRSF